MLEPWSTLLEMFWRTVLDPGFGKFLCGKQQNIRQEPAIAQTCPGKSVELHCDVLVIDEATVRP